MKDFMISTVSSCSLYNLSRISHPSGNLTFVNSHMNVPFDIKRVYYLYDIPGGQVRGGHAHKLLQQFIIAAAGSFEVIIDDGVRQKTIFLNRPDIALHIIPGIWRELKNFSSGSICLVLASEKYDDDDYVRSFDDFIKMKHS